MAQEPAKVDIALAHRHFAASCFNQAWEYLDRAARTPDQDEAMLLLALSSLWHWTQRPDCTAQNLSIGHWQVSRAFALVGQGENSLRHARRSLEFAEGLSPFFAGYGHEAIARAASLLGDAALFRYHVDQLQAALTRIENEEERSALQQDLGTLQLRDVS